MVLIFLVAGCTALTPSPAPEQQPWSASTPEEQGIDSTLLNKMMSVIEAMDLPIDSVVVVRHGQLVFEAYPNPDYGPNDLHLLYSTTKSVTSALVGIAIDQGFIKNVHQKVLDYFPEWNIKHRDARKEALTIEHLLTMSCGFEWQGPDDNLHTWGEANLSGNPVKFVLDQPMASQPGTEWLYNGGCSHLLSAILTETTGLSTIAFARQVLFSPLGITEIKWPRDPQGIYYGGQDIWLTPRDMAKFGQLYLNQGSWKDQQIVPADWVARSIETRYTHPIGGYGYQWWTYPQSWIYYAAGAFEQKIYVLPKLDMVVVFTADNKASGLKPGEIREGPPVVDWLLGRFILPAVEDYTAREYANYGFSLSIPRAMNTIEQGSSWQGDDSQEAGLVQFRYGYSPYESIGVQWDKVDSTPDLQLVLEEFSQALQGMGMTIQENGAPDAKTKAEHELILQSFEVTEGDYTYPGMVGAWYCDQTRRTFILYFAGNPELARQIDLSAEFERILDSFSCH